MSIHVLVLNVSLIEGMAGPKRVYNLLEPLYRKKQIILSNLTITTQENKSQIGISGFFKGIPYQYIGFPNLKNIWSIFINIKIGFLFILKNKSKVEKNILYIYDYPDLKNLLFIIFSKIIGFKIVFDIIEENETFGYPKGIKKKVLYKSAMLFIKLLPILADGVFTISHHLEKYINNLCGNRAIILHIPISVALNNSSLSIISNKKDEVNIFYGGSYAPKEKIGVENLIIAFMQVSKFNKNIRLILTGTGRPEDLVNINNIIMYNEHIIFKGYLNDEDYFQTLEDADLCCMVRDNSAFANAGFPYKLGEFLANGKVVLATNVGDVSYYLNKTNSLLINSNSVDNLIDGINRYLKLDDEMKTKIQISAIKTAEKYFDKEVLSLDVIRIFNLI